MNAAILERCSDSAAPSPPHANTRPPAREGRGKACTLAFILAGLVHGGLLVTLKNNLIEGPEFSVSAGDTSVEVTLVAAAPAAEAVAEPPAEAAQEPPVEPPPVEPSPVEPPPMPPPPEAMIEPVPAPEPPLIAQPKPLKPKPPAEKKPAPRRPAAPAIAIGDGSSPKPGLDATTAVAANGGDRAKPGYLRNPHPAYPEDARKARQEGLVQLRVRVGSEGSVSSVTLIRSSGFPLLDERALSTVRDRWSFRPARVAGLAVTSEVIIPIRFSLRD